MQNFFKFIGIVEFDEIATLLDWIVTIEEVEIYPLCVETNSMIL